MRILDEKGNELVDPDLGLGHLVPDTLVKHHAAVNEVPAEYRTVIVWQNPDDPSNRLERREEVSPRVPGKAAWDEKEHILRYVPYTEAELAEIAARKEAEEQARAEAEAEAKRRAELQERIEALPDQVEALNEAVAEAGAVIGENDDALAALRGDVSDLMEAVAEIGTLVAGE